ncbi:putative serine hydroxymethyltransferase 2 [Cardiosporidium cionae]|uniref:Serine hydroxymethyltransferase n=1 Tax=Cardiosporidium cionae TaxID=476202 RepID=A0ABQ7JCU3_9APIC|nr:putative serine hydroxymethyltransferase 2 [Cardiosporidium cionae]|eukprot:KAF8821745.1 putative serine hydroxymethyltransferase 2 [Cardiosporidium cionae]
MAALMAPRALQDQDDELYRLLRQEKDRQRNCIELIASENFTSQAVMECLGSCLTNKYSEGYPHARYYGGNEIIDQIELLCQERALKAFNLSSDEWAVNVQPYSGSPANMAAYVGIINPHDRIMGLDLPSGGHLTHGFYTAKKKVSATSIFFESLPYKVDEKTGWLDYDELHKFARVFRPKVIIAGTSAYPRDFDYKRFREICDDVGALLLADMAHISGLVAAKVGITEWLHSKHLEVKPPFYSDNRLKLILFLVCKRDWLLAHQQPLPLLVFMALLSYLSVICMQILKNPFEYCDVVTTTTHKSLRGPRSGVIFSNIKRNPGIAQKINDAVFPALQGGPHNHQIAALACQLKEVRVASPGWAVYAQQIIANSKVLAATLISMGYKIVTDGTDNHIVLWDLRPAKITGTKMQLVCDACGITLNKNSVHGDVSAMSPSGVRLGTPAMTSRGLKEADFEKVAHFLHRGALICQEITSEALSVYIYWNYSGKKFKSIFRFFVSSLLHGN